MAGETNRRVLPSAVLMPHRCRCASGDDAVRDRDATFALAIAGGITREHRMNSFEYLLSFASVILALAVCDLAVSLNRLLEAGAKVAWDWLTPFAAFVAFLKIVTQWWGWFGAAPLAQGVTFGMFLCVLIATVLLFLMAAASLPDRIEVDGLALRKYYAESHRRFWLLFAAHWTVSTATTVWIAAAVGKANLPAASPIFLIVPLALLLAFIGNRLLHIVCLVGLVALYVWQSFSHALGQ